MAKKAKDRCEKILKNNESKIKKKLFISSFSSMRNASHQGLPRVAHSNRCCYLSCVVDIARDTSDTEALDSDTLEYEPVTESEEDGPVDADSSGCSDVSILQLA